MDFDPNAAAPPDAGVFGLPHTARDARVHLVPVPFDATTSYGGGAAGGPDAILHASHQVDLYDHHFGRVYEHGIFMHPIPEDVAELSRKAREIASPIIERGGAGPNDADAVALVDDASARVRAFTHERTSAALRDGRIPGIIGGDHASPAGAITAAAEDAPIGLLQIDAHMDLRPAYEGFRESHASIIHNLLGWLPEDRLTSVVQVGIRDYCEQERDDAHASPRVHTHYDPDWAARLAEAAAFPALCAEALEPLPRRVWVTFDIDGLDPALCPGTGTPVPGGLSFNHASMLLALLARSGRTVVGFDLCEVSPSPERGEWDANVGARVLYKLIGCALASQPG